VGFLVAFALGRPRLAGVFSLVLALGWAEDFTFVLAAGLRLGVALADLRAAGFATRFAAFGFAASFVFRDALPARALAVFLPLFRFVAMMLVPAPPPG
jgi:hypothetical protein